MVSFVSAVSGNKEELGSWRETKLVVFLGGFVVWRVLGRRLNVDAISEWPKEKRSETRGWKLAALLDATNRGLEGRPE